MASKKPQVKQNIAPLLVETSKYTSGFHDKLPKDELPSGSATGSSYNFFLDSDGKWTTRKGSKYIGTNFFTFNTTIASELATSNISRDIGYSLSALKYGETFTPIASGRLRSCQFRLNKTGSPSGSAYAKIYALTGGSSDIGFDQVPSGNPLATSDALDVSTLTGTATITTITFSGSNRIILSSGTWYGISIEYAGDVSNYISVFENNGNYLGNTFISSDGVTWGYDGTTLTFSVTADTADTGGCTSSAKLLRRDGVEIPLVFYSTKSKYIHPDTNDWTILEIGYTANQIFGRAMGEKSTDNVNYLVFGNGVDAYRYWNGITGSIQSFTNNSITLKGSVILSDLGFTSTGSISDNGVQYAYTGISGQTFTGVTPDPTLSGMAANDPIAQSPVADNGLPVGNVFVSYSGRVAMFNKPSTALYGGGSIVGSKLNDYSDFSFSSPRVPAEGYQLIMAEGGGNGTALVHFEGGILCFKQNAVSFHQVTYDQNDAPSIQPFLPYDDTISGHVGCIGQKLAFALRNQVFFVSPRKIINTAQRVSQVDYPQSLPMSDRIQNTVDGMTWDQNCCGIGFNYLARFCGKATSTDQSPDKQLIYDQRFDCWWTPFIGQSISSYFVYGGNLYGTLADSPDVIQLDIGLTDFATATTNGNAINASLTLERQNFGRKSARKKSRLLYVEGWMDQAGTATFTLQLDENGAQYSGTLSGNENGYFFDTNTGGTFGVEPFGVDTFGGTWISDSDLPDGVGHFRILFNFPDQSFWNIQTTIATSNYFKLINHSTDARLTNVGIPGTLKKALS